MKKLFLRKRNILSLLGIILFVISAVLLFKIDLVDSKISIILCIGITIIYILSILMLNMRKKVLAILGSIILIIGIIISSIGSYFLYNTNSFLNKSFGSSKIITSSNYYLVTSKNSSLTMEDINGNVAYYKDSVNIKEAIDKLKSSYDVNLKSYEDVKTMFDNVLKETEKFMLVEQTSYNLVFKLDNSFKKDDFKILDQINVELDSENDNDNIKDSFNVYIGGTDFTGECVDFNMIVTINTKTNKVLMTSIPRDYYIPVYGVSNNKRDTLSYMGPYGINVSAKSIENFFGIKIDYYVKVNTTSLVEVVDKVGGITFCSDEAFTTTHALVLNTYDDTKGKKLHVKKGCQEVNGIEALTIARERNAFAGRDRVRQENCRKIIKAILDKLNNVNTIKNYSSILESFEGLYETNIPKEVVSKLAKTTINNKGKWIISEQEVNGTDTKDYVHLTNYKDWVMYPDMNTVSSTKENILNVLK